MPADHLGDNAGDDITEIEGARFGGNLGVEDDLEQDVSQFLLQTDDIPGIEFLEGLVGFLEQEPPEALVGLLTVPRATVDGSQPGHDQGKRGWFPDCGEWVERRDEDGCEVVQIITVIEFPQFDRVGAHLARDTRRLDDHDRMCVGIVRREREFDVRGNPAAMDLADKNGHRGVDSCDGKRVNDVQSVGEIHRKERRNRVDERHARNDGDGDATVPAFLTQPEHRCFADRWMSGYGVDQWGGGRHSDAVEKGGNDVPVDGIEVSGVFVDVVE